MPDLETEAPETDAPEPEAPETDAPSEGEGEEEKGKPDPLKDSIDRLASRMDSFMEQSRPDEDPLSDLFEPEDEYEYEDDESDPYFDDEDDEDLDDEARLSREADRIIDELVDRKVQERLAPHLQQQYDDRRHGQVVELEKKYTELQERKHAEPLLREAATLAKRLGEPELAFEAPFLETVYLRMKAEAARAEESEASGEDETPIEGAGGGKSASSETAEANLRKGIVDASKDKGIFG